MKCTQCHSFAINPGQHGRDDTDLDLCDVCYWRKRATPTLDKEDLRKVFEPLAKTRGIADFSRVPASGCYKDDRLQDMWWVVSRVFACCQGGADRHADDHLGQKSSHRRS